MMRDIFVFDETGSPGSKSESKMLKSDRVTYLAVYINKEIRSSLTNDLKELLLKWSPKNHPWKEFHFNEIVNRRKVYKDLDGNSVLKVIKEFANILNSYSLPFFNQTITPRSLQENGLKNNLNKTLDEIALDFLYCRIKNFIQKQNLCNEIDLIMDEGLYKNETSINVPILKNVIDNASLCFKRSEDDVLIQVADFFAYGLNRSQLIMIKDKVSEFDHYLISIFNSVFLRNQSSGSRSEFITNENFGKVNYDKRQIENLKHMGVYEFWKKVNE